MKSDLVQISDELFLKLGRMITDKYGIKMPPDKKVMFQARLQRRLRELNFQSFDEYATKLLNQPEDEAELILIADYISTNKTDFFREMDHFLFLKGQILPEFLIENKNSGIPSLKIWSAGCSSGQEAYSMAITLEEFLRQNDGEFEYSILATDISGKMLRTAKEAIYPLSEVSEMSLDLKKRYLLKSKIQKNQKIRIVKEIRNKVKVAYMNLMDGSYPFDLQFDVIFLRNTLIYFDQSVQLKVLSKALDSLKTGGYLFIGHSESLINVPLPIYSVAPSVYIKK